MLYMWMVTTIATAWVPFASMMWMQIQHRDKPCWDLVYIWVLSFMGGVLFTWLPIWVVSWVH